MIFKEICVCAWALWSNFINFIKVCLSSVLDPSSAVFPMETVRIHLKWDFSMKYGTCCKNAQSAPCFLAEIWAELPLCDVPGVWALGTCDPALLMTTSLEEQRFWQLWNTELFREKTYLIVGSWSDGFERPEQCSSCRNRCLWFQRSAADGALRSRSRKKGVKGKFVLTESIIQLLKTCFIMRTHNSCCHSIL